MPGGSAKLAAMHARIKALEGATITVGVHADAGEYDNGMKVSDVALINHFGTLDGKIPPRPFLTIAKKESEQAIKSKMMAAAKAASGGGDGVAIFKQAGDALAESARGVIDSVSTLAPNAPPTIARKGKNHPLYDTGRLRNSIKVKVKE